MSRKTHMIAVESPLLAVEDRTALCGQLVRQAKPIFKLDLEEGEALLGSGNTIMFCTVCLRLALAPMPGIRFIYAIAPAQEAHDEEEGVQ